MKPRTNSSQSNEHKHKQKQSQDKYSEANQLTPLQLFMSENQSLKLTRMTFPQEQQIGNYREIRQIAEVDTMIKNFQEGMKNVFGLKQSKFYAERKKYKKVKTPKLIYIKCYQIGVGICSAFFQYEEVKEEKIYKLKRYSNCHVHLPQSLNWGQRKRLKKLHKRSYMLEYRAERQRLQEQQYEKQRQQRKKNEPESQQIYQKALSQ